MLCQVRLHEPGSTMNVRTIPDHGEGAAQLPLELTQESNDVFRSRVGIVGQQREIKTRLGPLRTDRDATDGRDSIMAVPARQQRRLPLRSPRATYGRRQHEAGFIEKNHVCTTFARGVQDVGKRGALPMSDRLFVAFARTATRLLRRPLQPLPQESTDMIVMQRDAEVSANEIGNALGGP